MYRQVFVKSFASSASFDVVRMVLAPRVAEQLGGAIRRCVVVGADDLGQRVRSSSSAWPSAIRSGQNATSTSQPRAARRWATYSVVPG